MKYGKALARLTVLLLNQGLNPEEISLLLTDFLHEEALEYVNSNNMLN